MGAPYRQTITCQLQLDFLKLLPRIHLHAKISFRHVLCAHQKEEAIAETVALAWKWYVRLRERGKDPSLFPSVLASYAARATHSGRRLCGQERAKDALSSVAQKRHGFVVGDFPSRSTLGGNVWDEALHDNSQSPVLDQVSFRCDFPDWRKSRTGRDRRVIDALMVGERPLAVARRFGLSPARISQLRRELHDDWRAFN